MATKKKAARKVAPTVTYKAKTGPRKNEWVRNAAVQLAVMLESYPGQSPTERRDAAYRVVDLACHIWDQTEGRMMAGSSEDDD